MNRTLAWLCGSLLLSGTMFAGGVSGGSGVGARQALILDDSVVIQLPQLEVDPDVYRRLRAWLHIADKAYLTTPDHGVVVVKRKFSRIVDVDETWEIVPRQ